MKTTKILRNWVLVTGSLGILLLFFGIGFGWVRELRGKPEPRLDQVELEGYGFIWLLGSLFVIAGALLVAICALLIAITVVRWLGGQGVVIVFVLFTLVTAGVALVRGG